MILITWSKFFSEDNTETIDRDSYQKQIDELSKKLGRLNDLYIDDRITLEELQTKSAEFTSMRASLETKLGNDPAIKQKDRKKRDDKYSQSKGCTDYEL